jgi:hypothetical protein
LLFLSMMKVDQRFSGRVVGLRTPLRIETFIVYMTLGCLGAALVQAGIVHKFVFILTQKNPTPVDGGLVFSSMLNCLAGNSFPNEVELPALGGGRRMLVQGLLGCVILAGLVQSVAAARMRTPESRVARFDLAFFAVVFAVSFLAVYAQKPVYIYSRFFLYLPVLLGWVAARGWSMLPLWQSRAVSSQSRVELLRGV